MDVAPCFTDNTTAAETTFEASTIIKNLLSLQQ